MEKKMETTMGLYRGYIIPVVLQRLLGGPWDLVTAYHWAYNPTSNWGNPRKPL